jgi:hypothetical protein
MGGSSKSRANKFLYAPAPPPPSVWALKPPSCALVHKTSYAPMIYTALVIMFWMRAYPLIGQVGGGWALEFSFFLGPNGTRLSVQCHFTGPKKLLNSRAQTLPLALVMDMHASKALCTGLYNPPGCLRHRQSWARRR